MTPDEEWRPVVQWETTHEVSDSGRVRRVGGSVFKGHVGDNMHRRVNLRDHGRYRGAWVHQLVAEAFLGPRPDGMEVRHLNGDPLDNRVQNLRYGTKSENNLDMVRHGTHRNASKTHCPQDHEYTETNTYTWRGQRWCKTCRNDQARRKRASPGGVNDLAPDPRRAFERQVASH